MPEWDVNFYKLECGGNEFVSGITQDTSGRLGALRCSSGIGTSSACEVRVIDKGAGDVPARGDWDVGYYKAACPSGKVVVGVSQSPQNGKPHALLCCNAR